MLQQIKRDLVPEEQKALEGMIEKTQLPPPSKWPMSEVQPSKDIIKPRQLELTYGALAIEDKSKQKSIPLHYRSTFDVKHEK
jgi:hypothetical protein